MYIQKSIGNHLVQQTTWSRKSFAIHPTRTIFYIIFLLVFCLSGIITMADVVPYRMGVMSLLVLPLILLYGVKPDKVMIAYALLTLVVMLSGVVNSSSLSDIVLFLRILIFSYLIYYLVERFVNQKNIERIIKLCVNIGVIQLPVVVFQLLTYDWLPQRVKENIRAVDYDFGTFNFKGDSSMSFFLILLVVFLLFDTKRNYIIKHRVWVITCLTATVLIANSEMSKAILIVVWLAYFATHLTRKTTIVLLLSAALLSGILVTAGIGSENGSKFQRVYANTIAGLQGDPKAVTYYLEGRYSRGGAIYYFLNNELLWFGDGPSRYSDPFTLERFRGNVGHIFTFYSEVGLLGWVFSMVVFFLIVFRFKKGYLTINFYSILLFLCIFGLSFTDQIMNEISIVMIYCIMAKSYLILPLSQKILSVAKCAPLPSNA